MAKRLHVVPPVEPYIFLRARTGETYVYESYTHFIWYAPGYVIRSLGKNFNGVWHEWYFSYADYVAEWLGVILDPAQVKADWDEVQEKRRKVNRNSWWYRLNHRVFEFRNGPVPGIHKRSSHKGSYYRKIRTTQERRLSLAAKDDGVPWRGKRNFHNLPNAWDDICRRNEKNWKSFRKHQWKD